MTFVRAVGVRADDGITIPVPILLEDEESVVEFIDLPYSGVSSSAFVHYTLLLYTGNSLTSVCRVRRLSESCARHIGPNENPASMVFKS